MLNNYYLCKWAPIFFPEDTMKLGKMQKFILRAEEKLWLSPDMTIFNHFGAGLLSRVGFLPFAKNQALYSHYILRTIAVYPG